MSLSFDADLVLEGEDEGVVADLDPLQGLAALPGDRIRGVEPGRLDELGARQALQRRVDLAYVRRPPKRPALAVGAALDRVQVLVERERGVRLEPPRVDAA